MCVSLKSTARFLGLACLAIAIAVASWPSSACGEMLAGAAKVDALSGLSFGEISDYAEVPAGTYAVKVCATYIFRTAWGWAAGPCSGGGLIT